MEGRSAWGMVDDVGSALLGVLEPLVWALQWKTDALPPVPRTYAAAAAESAEAGPSWPRHVSERRRQVS